MNLIAKRIRGMQDLLPGEIEKWEQIEKVMRDEASVYGFKSIRTPVLEHTELFERSVGDESDIAQKEMYTFLDKGNRSVSLRPEGTAGALRAVLENGLHNGVLPVKLMYTSSCYRYEKPQSGRYREFFQFGMEVYGSETPFADAELISAAQSIVNRLGLRNVHLEINSIGCSECRQNYSKALIEYFNSHKQNLCPTCQDRLLRNPMRIFDCKCSECIEICKNAPVILDFICDGCSEHFKSLKQYLTDAEIEYTVNPSIVRGLDYYCKTVFEFVYDSPAGAITVCGGGRYDGLAQILSGVSLPAIGLGMGVERIIMALEQQNVEFTPSKTPEVYFAPMGENARKISAKICSDLRKASVYAEIDISGRSMKAQIRYADKIGAKYFVAVGDAEVESHQATIKNMETGEQKQISLNEKFLDEFLTIQCKGFKF